MIFDRKIRVFLTFYSGKGALDEQCGQFCDPGNRYDLLDLNVILMAPEEKLRSNPTNGSVDKIYAGFSMGHLEFLLFQDVYP